MGRRLLLTSILAIALAALGAVAAPAQAPRDELSFAFTGARTGAPAGFTLVGEFAPSRIIDRVTFTFPRGTRFDTGAVPQCRVSEAQIGQSDQPLGELCPPRSRIGTGTGTTLLGTGPDPVVFDLVLYARPGGAFLDILLDGRPAFYATPVIRGRRLTLGLELAPEIGARISRFELSVRGAGTRRRPFLRAPATCPRSGRLTASMTAREHQAGSVTSRDRTRCRR